MPDLDFKVIFWGVRGTRAVPGEDTLIYGGNTSCVQVQAGETVLILDGGTGLANLGMQLAAESAKPLELHLFFSHFHWDHIQGFPFFLPAYNRDNRLLLYGEAKGQASFASLLGGLMSAPYFPLPFDGLPARKDLREIKPGQALELAAGLTVKTARNNHPGGCLSFRIEYAGKSCCYCTDTEHYPGRVDAVLREFVRETDLLIYDANYTDAQYLGTDGGRSRAGWGHSTWQEGIRLAEAAGVGKLVLFHHDPLRGDRELASIEEEAQKTLPDCIAAREGLSVSLSPY